MEVDSDQLTDRLFCSKNIWNMSLYYPLRRDYSMKIYVWVVEKQNERLWVYDSISARLTKIGRSEQFWSYL